MGSSHWVEAQGREGRSKVGWRHWGTQTRCVSAPGQVQREPLACSVAAVASEEEMWSCQQDTDFATTPLPPYSSWICDGPASHASYPVCPLCRKQECWDGGWGQGVPGSAEQLSKPPLRVAHGPASAVGDSRPCHQPPSSSGKGFFPRTARSGNVL